MDYYIQLIKKEKKIFFLSVNKELNSCKHTDVSEVDTVDDSLRVACVPLGKCFYLTNMRLGYVVTVIVLIMS